MAVLGEAGRRGTRLDMSVFENLGIKREQRAAKNARSGHDHLVSGIAMKSAGHLRGLHGDTRSKRQKLDPRICKRQIEPFLDRTGEGHSLKLRKLSDLPAGNCANADTFLLFIQKGAQSGWNTGIAVNPPNPNMGVEK